MGRGEGLNPLQSRAERFPQLTQDELLRSQAVPLYIPEEWLNMDGTMLYPSRQVHIVNLVDHESKQKALQRVEILGVPYHPFHEESASEVPELKIRQDNQVYFDYSLDWFGYNIAGVQNMRIYPHPSDLAALLSKPSVVLDPGKDPYIEVASEEDRPSDLLMVIGEDEHCMVRPLTKKEASLLVKRDEESAVLSASSKPESHTVWQAEAPSGAPTSSTAESVQRTSARRARINELQGERKELLRGNKGKGNDGNRDALKEIAREIGLLNFISDEDFEEKPRSKWPKPNGDETDPFYGSRKGKRKRRHRH